MKALLCQYQGKESVLCAVNILSIGTDRSEQMIKAKHIKTQLFKPSLA